MTPLRSAIVLGVVLAGAVVAAVVLPRANDTSPPPVPSASASPPVAPPPGASFDYQIGAAYPPAHGVRVVSRDRSSSPAAGLYSICYVNAFQVQPSELGWWKGTHPDLLLRGPGGPVVDEDWNEALLDLSTPAKRTEAATIVGGWIDGCARRGFQAVEPDNLDSYERSDGHLTRSDNAAFAGLLARRAHAAGLAIGQKNAAELLPRHASIGFDFAVTEECGRYGECERYASAYANRVFDIEYRTNDFTRACHHSGTTMSIVLRDREVSPPGSPHYAFRTC
ncbi:endo alpha-1,4 polygalactosaminidase [Actinoallomurus bryophytorum]|uniref:Glycosyl hydrolase family 114 n=1 Tax=Actinoallomurus bryophytorum TaxID=1490222 RepID=A0A543CN94_9ACTN|nr:endo alpha-1,4 polygalactosaminidase [Actinoallomurus bryophytorum]TQL98569.1 glycosyl hydrolase family 114 [Actinoallomurus bryophytorum]